MRASVSALFLASLTPSLHECFTRSYTRQASLCYAIGTIFYVDWGCDPGQTPWARHLYTCLFHNS